MIVLSPPPALERLVGGSDPYGYVAQSTEERAQIYPAVWHEILQRPIVGHGFEYVRGAHNIYLQLLHAGGIIALTAFLIFAAGITYERIPPEEQRCDPDRPSKRCQCLGGLPRRVACGGRARRDRNL